MSEPVNKTSITSAGVEEPTEAQAPVDRDDDADDSADLTRETIEQELKGYPDQPTTS